MLTLTNIQRGADNTAGARADENFLHSVLEIVRARTGVDFACYRAPMLERRVANHFASSGACSNEAYLRRLQVSPAAAFRLLERITIKVSRFYRNAPTFDFLRDTLLQQLSQERVSGPLRIWCAGCGAGEEAYTFAMLLDQAGIDGHIEATDVDATALNEARAGIYPITAAAELPVTFTEQYLEPVVARGQPGYRAHEHLRARIRFSRHDVTSDAPAPGGDRFDLVSCRNVFIYLQRAAQAKATRRLLDVIRDNGVLCLGEAEWPVPELAAQLEPMAHKTRLFRVRPPVPFVADHELNCVRFRAMTGAVAVPNAATTAAAGSFVRPDK